MPLPDPSRAVTLDYTQLLHALMPEAQLVVGALLVLGLDLAWARHRPENRVATATLLGLIALVVAVYHAATGGTPGPVYGGVLVVDLLTVAARVGVIALAALALAFLPGPRSLRNPAEFVAVLLCATAGFSLMAAANQLLLAFLGLELASLSLYILAGFDRSRPESAEAALKYFLVGGISSAFLLFGFSLLYGLTGTIDFPHLAWALSRGGVSPLLMVALVMVLVAFGFKAAAAPFHLWAPDVYEGAPAPSAALIASASKLAGLVLFVRLLWPGLGDVAGDIAGVPGKAGWLTVVALLSAASLLLGNIGALAQANVRRLLAYSAIGHAGAMLLGVCVAGPIGPGPVYYYAVTYGLAAVGAFGLIATVERHGRCQLLTDLAGLRQRSPLLAGCLLVFILSLAGVPPLAGFVGKFSVFSAAFRLAGVSGPAGWLALLAIAMSAVALYYYLLILKQALVAAPEKGAAPIPVPWPSAIALVLAAGLIVLLGVFPSLILGLVS